jgi:hypothetical protein
LDDAEVCEDDLSSCQTVWRNIRKETYLVIRDTHSSKAILAILERDAASQDQARYTNSRYASSGDGDIMRFESFVHIEPPQSKPYVGSRLVIREQHLLELAKGDHHATSVTIESRVV